MWSDKELDDAFRRLNPPEPEAEPFPLDAWLRLEQQLDKQVLEREVRRRLWRFLALEMLVVGVGALLWLAWPARQPAAAVAGEASATRGVGAMQVKVRGLESATAARSSQSAATAPAASADASGAVINSTAEAGAIATAATEDKSALTEHMNSLVSAKADAGLTVAPGAAGHIAASPVRPATGAAADSAVAASRGRLVAAGVTVERPRTRAIRKPTTRAREHAAGKVAATARSATSGLQAGADIRPGEVVAKRRRSALLANASAVGNHNSSQLSRFSEPETDYHSTSARLATTPEPPVSALSPAASAAMAEADATTSGNGAAAAGVAHLPLRLVALQTESGAALPAPLATIAQATAPLPEPLYRPRLYLGLLAAPDVSTVKMADYQAPTPNLGLLLEYRLTQRLRVSTGLLRSTKQYRARKQDYDWSYYPTAANGDFKWVDGRCTILDVPLNLRYDVLARPRYQLFGAAGLSSLFMQRETYAYDYEYYGRPYRWERSFTNENQHWFSVLNLSVGYERNLGRHWRLQAEPYLKLPLGGVGAGKVRLMSGGVFFGVKYGL